MTNPTQHGFAKNPRSLFNQIQHRLSNHRITENWDPHAHQSHIKGSAVLFLLTLSQVKSNKAPEVCILFNKRSQQVIQPGDLCCPGGGIERVDKLLRELLRLPFSPLIKWTAWPEWKSRDRRKAQMLMLMLTTALRESWEEMRLNPMKLKFLGPLPMQGLVMFQRQIIPLVGWVPPNQRLVPNWEVERIIHIPLRRLFEAQHYARYRLSFHTIDSPDERKEDFPCFLHSGPNGNEILWGATFRITMDFLNLVFGFQIPQLSGSRIINRRWPYS